MAVGDAYVFPGFLTPVLTQLFLPKPPTTFLTCFCRGKRRKYAGKKLPQPGIELTTTRSWVWHAHHWATHAGLFFRKGTNHSATRCVCETPWPHPCNRTIFEKAGFIWVPRPWVKNLTLTLDNWLSLDAHQPHVLTYHIGALWLE